MKRKIMALILGVAMLMTVLPVAGMATEAADPAAIAASASQNIVEEASAPETQGEVSAASNEAQEGEAYAEQPQTPAEAQPSTQSAAPEASESAGAPGSEPAAPAEAVAPGEIAGAADGAANEGGAPDGTEQTVVGSTEAEPQAPAPALSAELIAPKNVTLDGGIVTVQLRAASSAAEIAVRYYLLVDEQLVNESETVMLTNGEANFSFTPTYGGIYTVRAELSDSEGNLAQAAASIAVAEREPEEAVLAWYDAARQAAAAAGDPLTAVAAAARSQLGYAQSAKDILFDENGNLHSFNIYSDYESDWNMSFASWCAAQAGVEALAGKKDIPALADAMANANALLLGGYLPVAGDLSFVMMEDGSVHAGVIVAVNEASFDTIEGDCNGAVELRSYALDDANLKAFGSMAVLLGMDPQDAATEQGGDAQPQPEEQITYYCGMKEHVHNHGCYGVSESGEPVLICGQEQHEHTEACLVPQQAEAQPEAGGEAEETAPEAQEQSHPAGYMCGMVEHEHGEDCYDENGELVCGMEAHTHDESCLTAPEPEPDEPEPEPGEPEVEYLCGKVEHEHGEDCYDENGELVCGMEAHTHDASCLAAQPIVEPAQAPEHEACGYERDADGKLILDEVGNPIPILAEGATEKPVSWLHDEDGALLLDENGDPIPVRYVPVSASKIENLADALDPNRHIDIYIHWADETAETHSFGDEAVLTAVLTGYDNVEYTLQWQTGKTEDAYEDVPGATEAECVTVVTEENLMDYWRVAVTVTDVADTDGAAEAEATEIAA